MKMKYKIKQLTLSLWVRTVFLLGFFCFLLLGWLFFGGVWDGGRGYEKSTQTHSPKVKHECIE